MKRKGKRYLGVDLHHDSCVVCIRSQGRVVEYRRWQLEQMTEFAATLKADDEVAVEATGNTRWFCRQLEGRIKRVVVVNPHQFRVICDSTKEDGSVRDATLLAEYLEKDLLPEVRQKTDQQSEVAQLAAARDQLVKMRTMLKNQVHGLLRSHAGVNQQTETSQPKKVKASCIRFPCLRWPACNARCCSNRSRP